MGKQNQNKHQNKHQTTQKSKSKAPVIKKASKEIKAPSAKNGKSLFKIIPES